MAQRKLRARKRRLRARRKGYDEVPDKKGYKQPGSMNPHKNFSIKGFKD